MNAVRKLALIMAISAGITIIAICMTALLMQAAQMLVMWSRG